MLRQTIANLFDKTPQISSVKTIKLGSNEIDYGAKYLMKLGNLVRENATETQVPLALPTLKIVLTGTEYGYRRDDEVFVIPLGYLWD